MGCGLRAGGAPAHGVEPGPGSGFRTGDIAISGPRKSDIAISGRYTISVCICVYIYIYICVSLLIVLHLSTLRDPS